MNPLPSIGRLAATCAILLQGLSAGATAPLALWEFENTPGFLANSAGAAYGLSNEGAVTALPGGGPGHNQAAVFSGTNRLTTPDAPAWSSTRFTIEAYFRLGAVSTGTTQVIVSHHNNTGNQRGWHLAEVGGKLRFAKSNDGAGLVSLDRFTLAANTSYYAAVIADFTSGNVSMILKNLTSGTAAALEPASTTTGLYDAASPLAIGSTGTTATTGSSFFTGTIDAVRFTADVLATTDLQEPFTAPPVVPTSPVSRLKADGYKGIWFTLGQNSTYGDKYSGGLATYTANHSPMAVYSSVANKTFFTYGGTTGPTDRHLLIMAGEYDHATHTVTKPTVVMDKVTVDDPHDNGCITIDSSGYLWVFISGRGTARPGFTYRSAEPYSTDGFFRISAAAGENYTYPQVWYDPDRGFFHLLTRYNGGQRELFYRSSPDGVTWSAVVPFAQIQGHYQVSGRNGNLIATFFNRHPGGNVDARTDLYYLQTTDWGQTWTKADGTPVTIPLTTADNPARIFNYSSLGRLMYGIDLSFDKDGHPILLYLTSSDYRPGPGGEPRTIQTARWTGTAWEFRSMPPAATAKSTATHNYAMGSLWVDGDTWTAILPTGADPAMLATNANRYWGQGGELELWKTTDQGANWTKVRQVTENSPRKHGYVRKPSSGTGRFFAYWGDGNPDTLSECHLYFGNAGGTRRWELPYNMTTATARPAEVNPPYLRWQKSYFSTPQIADPLHSGPDADPDGDGRTNLEEYADGSLPLDPASFPQLTAGIREGTQGKFLALGYRWNTEAADLRTTVETSGDLKTWADTEADFFDVSRIQNGAILEIIRGDQETIGLPADRFYRMTYELDE